MLKKKQERGFFILEKIPQSITPGKLFMLYNKEYTTLTVQMC